MHIRSLVKCILMASVLSLAACESGDDLDTSGSDGNGSSEEEESGGDGGTDTGGPTGTPIDEAITLLDASQLCAVLELGPIVAEAAGAECANVGPGGEVPLDPAA